MKKKPSSSGRRQAQSKKRPAARNRKTERVDRDLYAPQLSRSVVPRARAPAPRNAPPLKLSKCAAKYALAIAEPFHPSARGSCVPINATETHKTQSFVRGECVIGLGGIGFVAVAPCLANDLPSIYTTTATYAGASTVPIVLGGLSTGIIATVAGNHPYSASQLTLQLGAAPRASGRIVSAGLSVQYVGTALNESGIMYSFRDPVHQSALTDPSVGAPVAATSAYYGKRAEAEICPFTRQKCFVRDFACNAGEMAFAQDPVTDTTLTYPFCGGNTAFYTSTGASSNYIVAGLTVGVPTNVIMFTGVPGQTAHFEYIVHAEYTGVAAQSMVTPVESDPVGIDHVAAAASTLAERANSYPQQSRPSGWTLMFDALYDIGKAAIPLIIPKAIAGIASLLL